MMTPAAGPHQAQTAAQEQERNNLTRPDHLNITHDFTQFELHGLQSLMVQTRMYPVDADVFFSSTAPTRKEVQNSLSPRLQCGGHGRPLRLSIPAVTCVMHPGSLFARIWAALMIIVTVTYVAFLVPIFIAFNAEQFRLSRWPAAVDMVCGALLATDVILNFRTGIFHSCQGQIQLVLDPWHVASHYARGFLAADFAAIIPWIVQVILLLVDAGGATRTRNVPAETTNVNILRILRLARLRSLGTAGLEVWLVRKTGTPIVVFGGRILVHFLFVTNIVACALIASAQLYSGYCDSWVRAQR